MGSSLLLFVFSLFRVLVLIAIDASKTYAEGPGLDSGNVQDHVPTEFVVYSVGPDGNRLTEGDNDIEVRIRSPKYVPTRLIIDLW